MNKLSVNHLTKSFAGQTVLNQISFEAHAGSITALLGCSGAGKSTLLRCLCNLEQPDAGSITLNGKTIGVVFQQFHLWKHMTLLENCILAPIHALKLSKKLATEQAKALLLQLGLLDKKDLFPSTLSGGEQQRGAIARALMMKPDILLFDEPTSALDPERTETVSSIIESLAEQGIIILMVTHDISFASRIASRALFLEKGSLLEEAIIDPLSRKIFSKTERFSTFLNYSTTMEH